MNKQSEKAYGLSDLYSAISSMLQPRMEQSLSKVSVLIGWFFFRRVKVEWAGFEYAGDEPAEDLISDDENFLLATKEIRFFPENVIKAELIDESVQEMALNPCWPDREQKRKKRSI